MKKNLLLMLLSLALLVGCEQKSSYEDIQLSRLIAEEQLIANNNFVKSMQAQLTFFGAPADEGKYYHYSDDIVKLRMELLNETGGLSSFSDTVDLFYEKYRKDSVYREARDRWGESMEHLHQYYKASLNDEFDSVTYFRFKYTTLKKEYAVHMFNAQMLPN